MGITSKLRELKEEQLNALIADKFAQWEAIKRGESNKVFTPDGQQMNYIRAEIVQLRRRRDKLFNPPMAGQLTFFGYEVEGERPLPEIMPSDWIASEEKRKKRIQEKMFAALSQKNGTK